MINSLNLLSYLQMRIRSKKDLISYIRSQLGEPIIKVEVTDSQMSEMIDAAVQKFTEYCGYTLEESVVIQLHGAKEYPLPDKITNIISLKTGLSGNLTDFASNFGDYIPNLWSDMYFSNSLTGDIIPNIMMISATTSVLDKYFGTDIYYNFNQHRKILQVFDPYEGPAVLHYQYEYIANEEDDLIYNHEWIKAYCIAKTKEIWGSILGKYSQSLVGGAQINYGDIKSEAQSEIEKLEQELLDKWSDPVLPQVF